MKLNTTSVDARIHFGMASIFLLFIPSIAFSQERTHDKDLVLHYTFDQRDGDAVVNALGELHLGEPDEATFVEQKKSGNALTVRRNNQRLGYVETPNHADFNATKFTVAAWINLEQTHANGSVVCKHDWLDGAARGFVLRCYNGKQLNFTIGAGGWLAAQGATILPAHQWVHVVGSFDGTNIRVYVNGREDGTKAITKPYEPSPYPLRIGHATFSLDAHRKFDGKIDDVMFWKRTLSEVEILAVYDEQKDDRPAPLVAADIADVINKLGSKKFQTRKEAQQELADMGTEVLPLLDEYLKTDDAEIVIRIEQVKKSIEGDTRRKKGR